ncbi:MAG: hypothetical protein BroJett038_18570 [Chloroflexota bacterium]|jgi:hypothetical protein|nr:MAG: hypothetical protein BroJett038_18570 [Chloroflexota bacterium]
MTILRQILETFEQANEPLSLTQVARRLEVEPHLLEAMMAYWVRKGAVREVTTSGCAACSLKNHCAPLLTLPRRYERVTGETDAPSSEPPPCACCR